MTSHIPVLVNEIRDLLVGNTPPAHVIDGTLGAGGHTRALLDAGVQQVLGLDRDPNALTIARAQLADYGVRLQTVQANYTEMAAAAMQIGWFSVDAIMLDVGVSSMQLDTPERGFSFMHDGPLDMRMNPERGETAADLVNRWEADALADIFFRYGEERHGRKLARTIIENRPYQTTGDLVRVIEANKPAQWKEKIHPATRVFQALRIAINDELGALETVIPTAIHLLRPGGRLAIISFHSLEDRIVKHAFKDAATDCVCPPEVPVCVCNHPAIVKIITRKPVTASATEIEQNPRSRSAKLRVVERI